MGFIVIKSSKKITLSIFVTLFLCAVFSALIAAKIVELESASEKKQIEEPDMKKFKARYEEISIAMNPLEDAMKSRDKGDYVTAEKLIRQSLELHQKYNVREWLPRYQLAEILGLQDKRTEAVEQLNWLIKNARSKKTAERMRFKRDKFLKGIENNKTG